MHARSLFGAATQVNRIGDMSAEVRAPIRVGVAGRGGIERRATPGIDLVEIELPSPLPRSSTVTRWLAGPLGELERSARLVWPCADPAAALQAARGLGARLLVVTTAVDFRPGEASRASLTSLCRDWGAEGIVWEPTGLWEEAAIERLVRDLGISQAFDPTQRRPALFGPNAYLRLRGLGPSAQRHAESALERAAELAIRLAERSPVYCILASVQAVRDAGRLRHWIDDLSTTD